MDTIIKIALTILGLAVAGLYAFVKKKMEGLATRSDLEDVERIVRQVEHESRIKTTGELFIIERQRDAVIDLFTATRKVTDFIPRKYPEKLVKESTIDRHRWEVEILAVVKKMEEAKANFDLYIDDAQLIERGGTIVGGTYNLTAQIHEDFNQMLKLANDITYGGSAGRDVLRVQYDDMVAKSKLERGSLQQRVEGAMKLYGEASRRFLRDQTKVKSDVGER